MEEILASIRKIISDDDAKPAAKPAAPPPPAAKVEPPPPSEPQGQDDIDALFASFDDPTPEPAPPRKAEPEVLQLTEEMAAPFDANDLDFVDPTPEPPPPPPPPPRPAPVFERAVAPPPPLPPQHSVRLEDRLISSATDAAITAAFGSLTNTILSQNARTLEDLVQDMLRPMLKSWLDDNLPSLVERLVRGEIERVSRGGR